MTLEETSIKTAKSELEGAMAQDECLDGLIEKLESANLHFKDQMKHANMHIPKGKAKAKAGKTSA